MTWVRMAYLGVYDWGRDIYKISLAMVMGGGKNSTSTSTSTSNGSTSNGTMPGGEDVDKKEKAAHPLTVPLPTNKSTSSDIPTGPYAYLESLTTEEWETHISPYLQSYQYSMRSSQLDKVGFPIDHNAVLWCRQLVNQVSNAMRKLASDGFLAPHMPISPTITSTAGSNGGHGGKSKDMALPQALNGNSTASGGYFTRLLPYSRKSHSRRHISQALRETNRMISPVATFHLKNATSYAYNTIAPIDEFNYIARRLSGLPHHTPRGEDWERAKLVEREKEDKKKEKESNSDSNTSTSGQDDRSKSNLAPATLLGFLQAVGVWYVSNALPYILSAHLLIAILILAIPIRRRLTNYRPRSAGKGVEEKVKGARGSIAKGEESEAMMDVDALSFSSLFLLEDLLPLSQVSLSLFSASSQSHCHHSRIIMLVRLFSLSSL